jgi:effector-binding domain-containing protein
MKMKPFLQRLFSCAFSFAGIFIISCNSNAGKDAEKIKADSIMPAIKKVVKPEPVAKYERPPIINIADTLAPKRIIIFCRDSAATYDRISFKLAKIYGTKLADYIKRNNLKPAGQPMAWYKKQKAPYFFEAGIPVNKKGTKPVHGVQTRELNAGKVVVAHFYGPFDLLPQGYDAVKERMKDTKKIPAGAPYEIYVTDPVDKNGKPVDPYKIRTDIIFPVK